MPVVLCRCQKQQTIALACMKQAAIQMTIERGPRQNADRVRRTDREKPAVSKHELIYGPTVQP